MSRGRERLETAKTSEELGTLLGKCQGVRETKRKLKWESARAWVAFLVQREAGANDRGKERRRQQSTTSAGKGRGSVKKGKSSEAQAPCRFTLPRCRCLCQSNQKGRAADA
ncbi:uncharacterized protein SPSK_00940 [Sporothrix schenckii 1099-18]|uniref:Uncharacterized protein n=1 Tax=Sporothrix schenckii 1099-18 TaxID=1397361 RepID=A0A0F2LZ26_SPOSC|nr:uncharacterized protein SPSK_00940 [Sporothrix schenckii 1099-18]KJR81755.1 hypothetical protein SPSK_00940 [Sporothrix schenckii 1099-18]